MVKRRAYHPFLDTGMKKWIYATARKNYWRVASWMDLDDLIQEGFWAYAVCRSRYAVEDKGHFMSLVKITYINQINDLANKKTRTLEVSACELAATEDGTDPLENLAGGENSQDIELAELLARAPEQVRTILRALSTDDGAERLRRPSRLRQDGTRETRNERLCRIGGVPLFDVEAAIYDLFVPKQWDWADELVNRLFARTA